ncbi:aldo/keto reductase, partial [Massilia arenosa]
ALYGGTAEQDRPVVDALDACAQARGLPLAQVALAWLLHDRRVTAPVIGATRIEHIDHACAALEVQLSAAERAALERPYRPRPWSFAEP